jgi:hypothetical protein
MARKHSWYTGVHDIWKKLELWVTSVTDTLRSQYYDVQTLEYRYISKLIISSSKF